jgi:hypothetical protein
MAQLSICEPRKSAKGIALSANDQAAAVQTVGELNQSSSPAFAGEEEAA